jgi:hypothetical protein
MAEIPNQPVRSASDVAHTIVRAAVFAERQHGSQDAATGALNL